MMPDKPTEPCPKCGAMKWVRVIRLIQRAHCFKCEGCDYVLVPEGE